MKVDEPDPDRDLWRHGSHRWLRIMRRSVRTGRPAAHAAHVTMRRRFAAYWATLEAETFRPLIQRAREREAHCWGAGMLDWRHGLLATVLEVAYWWGIDAEAEPDRTAELRAAADELRGIDRELRDLAERMADLFERGEDLRNRFALASEWSAPGPDLAALLEEVAQWPRYRSTCLDPEAGLDALLRYWNNTTRPAPALGDLLNALAMCEPGEPVALIAADAEALATRQGSRTGNWSERVRLLFATLADRPRQWRDRRGRVASALDCCTPAALATLANVAAGFDPHDCGPPALSVEAIDKALRRFRGARTRPQVNSR